MTSNLPPAPAEFPRAHASIVPQKTYGQWLLEEEAVAQRRLAEERAKQEAAERAKRKAEAKPKAQTITTDSGEELKVHGPLPVPEIKPLTEDAIRTLALPALRKSVRGSVLTADQYKAELARRVLRDTAMEKAPADLPGRDSLVTALDTGVMEPLEAWDRIRAHWQRSLGITSADAMSMQKDVVSKEAASYEHAEQRRMEVAAEKHRISVRDEALEEHNREKAAKLTNARPPELKWLEELEEKPIEWVIEGFLEEKTNMIVYGPPKVGKSTFITNILLSLLLEEPFLGRFPVAPQATPRKVLYIQPELSEARTSRYLKALREAGPGRVGTFITTSKGSFFNPLDPVNRSEWVAQFKGHGFTDVVDDGLRVHLDDLGLNENDDASKYLNDMVAFCDEIGAHNYFLAHHSGKDGRIRGSSTIPGWGDVLTELRGEDDDEKMFKSFGRDVDIEWTSIAYDEATRRLTAYDLSPEMEQTAAAYAANVQHHDAVLKAAQSVQDAGKNVTPSAVSKVVKGVGREKVKEVLDDLVKANRLEAIDTPAGLPAGSYFRVINPILTISDGDLVLDLDEQLTRVYESIGHDYEALTGPMREVMRGVYQGLSTGERILPVTVRKTVEGAGGDPNAAITAFRLIKAMFEED